jgi:hypothetical protein
MEFSAGDFRQHERPGSPPTVRRVAVNTSKGDTMRFCHSYRQHLSACVAAALLLALAAAAPAAAQTKRRAVKRRAAPSGPVAPAIPRGTEMKIRLSDEIDTKDSRDGDRFTATVISPNRYDEAKIEGHVARVQQSGKLKGKTALSLDFDRITFSNGASAPFSAQVVRVYGEDSAKRVGEEGDIESGSKGKTTTKRTVGGAAIGAAIGAIAGGGKGAAIGAAVGAGAGAGAVFIQGSNRVKLEPGTEILIRTTR